MNKQLLLIALFLSLIGSVLSQNQSRVNANLSSAISHTNNKEYMEAIIACTYTIKSDSSNADAYYLRAYGFFMLDNKPAALKDVNRSISINPNNSDSYILRGKIFKALGKYIAAYKDLKTANSLNPAGTLLGVTKIMFSSVLPGSKSD
jgi:tetratricopeptide (TPR) repeat protein